MRADAISIAKAVEKKAEARSIPDENLFVDACHVICPVVIGAQEL